MKTKHKWIVGSTIIAALITGGFALLGNSNTGKSKVKQSSDTGNNLNAGADLNEAGRDNLKAGRDINQTTVYGDTSGKKPGPDVIITSINQSGGITAQNVTVINVVNPFVRDPQKKLISKKDNYQFFIDSITKTISFKPKEGSWKNTFIGIPQKEKTEVMPHFGIQNGNVSYNPPAIFGIATDSVFGIQAVSAPASPDNFYSLKYKKLPSYLIFGEFNGPLYKVNLAKYQ